MNTLRVRVNRTLLHVTGRVRSPRGFIAAGVFLLLVPLAVVYQMLVGDNGFTTFIHLVLATGALFLSLAVFDFSKMARWITWTACLAVGAEAAIFLLQAVSPLLHSDALTYLAYHVLGQQLEAAFVDVFVIWCAALVLMDSQGKTRMMGLVAVGIAVCFETYKYYLFYRGDAPAESLRLVFLLLFVWLLLESSKQLPLQAGTPPDGSRAAPGFGTL